MIGASQPAPTSTPISIDELQAQLQRAAATGDTAKVNAISQQIQFIKLQQMQMQQHQGAAAVLPSTMVQPIPAYTPTSTAYIQQQLQQQQHPQYQFATPSTVSSLISYQSWLNQQYHMQQHQQQPYGMQVHHTMHPATTSPATYSLLTPPMDPAATSANTSGSASSTISTTASTSTSGAAAMTAPITVITQRAAPVLTPLQIPSTGEVQPITRISATTSDAATSSSAATLTSAITPSSDSTVFVRPTVTTASTNSAFLSTPPTAVTSTAAATDSRMYQAAPASSTLLQTPIHPYASLYSTPQYQYTPLSTSGLASLSSSLVSLASSTLPSLSVTPTATTPFLISALPTPTYYSLDALSQQRVQQQQYMSAGGYWMPAAAHIRHPHLPPTSYTAPSTPHTLQSLTSSTPTTLSATATSVYPFYSLQPVSAYSYTPPSGSLSTAVSGGNTASSTREHSRRRSYEFVHSGGTSTATGVLPPYDRISSTASTVKDSSDNYQQEMIQQYVSSSSAGRKRSSSQALQSQPQSSSYPQQSVSSTQSTASAPSGQQQTEYAFHQTMPTQMSMQAVAPMMYAPVAQPAQVQAHPTSQVQSQLQLQAQIQAQQQQQHSLSSADATSLLMSNCLTTYENGLTMRICSWIGCGKKFDKPSALRRHLRTHTGEKPFQCRVPGCGMTFSERGNAKRHEKTHSLEKNYRCLYPECGQRFGRKQHADFHMQSKHMMSHQQIQQLESQQKHTHDEEQEPFAITHPSISLPVSPTQHPHQPGTTARATSEHTSVASSGSSVLTSQQSHSHSQSPASSASDYFAASTSSQREGHTRPSPTLQVQRRASQSPFLPSNRFRITSVTSTSAPTPGSAPPAFAVGPSETIPLLQSSRSDVITASSAVGRAERGAGSGLVYPHSEGESSSPVSEHSGGSASKKPRMYIATVDDMLSRRTASAMTLEHSHRDTAATGFPSASAPPSGSSIRTSATHAASTALSSPALSPSLTQTAPAADPHASDKSPGVFKHLSAIFKRR